MLAAVLVECYIVHIALYILVFFFLVKIKFQKLCKAVYDHNLPSLQSALGPKKDVRSASYPKIQSTHSVYLSISGYR